MKVWSLEMCAGYEGNTLVGVFGTYEEAEKAKEAATYQPEKWHIESWEILAPTVAGKP